MEFDGVTSVLVAAGRRRPRVTLAATMRITPIGPKGCPTWGPFPYQPVATPTAVSTTTMNPNTICVQPTVLAGTGGLARP